MRRDEKKQWDENEKGGGLSVEKGRQKAIAPGLLPFRHRQ